MKERRKAETKFPWLLVTACGVVVLVAGGLWVRHMVNRVDRIMEEARRSLFRLHEQAAISMLRDLADAQDLFRVAAIADADGDGQGEYGDLEALADAVLRRDPPLDLDAWIEGKPIGLGGGGDELPRALGNVGSRRIRREGYHYIGFLPAGGGDADLAERHWCAYAWPTDDEAGTRAFFVNETGEILSCDGLAGPMAPASDAAYLPGPPGITGPAAADAKGRDGRHWSPISGMSVEIR